MSIIKIITYLFIFYIYNIYSINLIDNHLPISSLHLDINGKNEITKINNGVIKINYIEKNNTETHSFYGFYSFGQILVDSQFLHTFMNINKLWFTNDNKKYVLFDIRSTDIKYRPKLLNIFFNSSQTESPFTEYLYSSRAGNSWPTLLIANLEAEHNNKAIELLTIFTPFIEHQFRVKYEPKIEVFNDHIYIVDIVDNSFKFTNARFYSLIVGHIQSSTSTEEVHEISTTTLANITSNGKLYYLNKSNKSFIFGIAKIGVLSDLDLGSSVIICVKKCRLGGFISKIINIKLDKDIARDYGINVTGNDEKPNATIFSINTILQSNITENSKIKGGISFAYTITDLNTGEIKSLDIIPEASLPITSSSNKKKPNAILGMQQDSNKSKETPTHDITPRLVLPNETQPSTSLKSLGIRLEQPTNQLSESSKSTNQQGIKRPRTDNETTTRPTKQLYKVPNQVNITTDQQGIKRPRTDNKTQQTHPTKQLYKVPNKVNITTDQQGIKRSRTDNETTTDPTKQLYKVPNQVNITTDQQGIKRSRTDNETTTDPTKQLYKVPNKVNITTDQQSIKRSRTDNETTTDPTKQLYKVPNKVNITTDQQGIKRSRTDNETTTDPTKQLYKVPNQVNITTDQQGIKRPRTDDRQPFEDDNPPSPDYFSDSDRGPLNVINESKNKYHRVNLKDLVNDCYSRIIIRTFDDVQHKQLVEESSELKEYPPESSINDENIDTFLNGLPRKYDYKNTIDPEKIVAPENESKKNHYS